MTEKYKNLCRLCLEQNPDFCVYEDKISTKITALLTGKNKKKLKGFVLFLKVENVK